MAPKRAKSALPRARRTQSGAEGFERTLVRLLTDRAFREVFFVDPRNRRTVKRDELEHFMKLMGERRRAEAVRHLHHLHAVLTPRELGERFDADAAQRALPSWPRGERRYAADALAFAFAMQRMPGRVGEAADKEASRAIYGFVVEQIGADFARFDGDFDLPLQIVTQTNNRQILEQCFEQAGSELPPEAYRSDMTEDWEA